MGIEANKQIVRDYFALTNAGRWDEAGALLADDFHYRCRGLTPETVSTLTKAQLLAANARSQFWKTRVSITVDGMTAEADRVAVQARSQGEIHDGTPYANAYHFLITLRDRRIVSLDEYFCTATFRDVVFSRRGTAAGG